MRASLKTSVAILLTAATLAVAAASPAQAWTRWHHGYGHGWGWGGPALAFGIIGAAVAADVAASGCTEYRPVYDQWGRYLGRRAVNVCY